MITNREITTDITRVTEAIANCIAVEGDLEKTDVEELQTQLVDCVEAVNGRLRRCDELLRRGLRSEAIQECEIEPMLLDVVTQLDMPEWNAWSDYVRQFGIAPTPALLLDVAAELNTAYIDHEPLDSLLRLHRLHALARSPLSNRLDILRRIGEKDPSNPVWTEDLRLYETERLRQIGKELGQLRKSRDFAATVQLAREVNETNWTVQLPAEIAKGVTDLHQELVRAHAMGKLAELSKTINGAFSEFDVDVACKARDEWQRFADIAGVETDDEIAASVDAAFDWLNGELRQQELKTAIDSATNELEFALDTNKIKRDKLERCYNTLQRYGETIPERLERRYFQRLEELDRAANRRFFTLVAAIMACIITLGSLSAVVIRKQSLDGKIRDASELLAQQIESKRFSEARKFLESIENDSPRVFNSQAVQRLLIDLNSGHESEQARQVHFQEVVQRASNKMTDDPTWDDVEQAESSLREAEAIAGSESEITTLRRIQGRVQDHRDRLQALVDNEFRDKLQSIALQLKDLNSVKPSAVQKLQESAKQLLVMSRVSHQTILASNIHNVIKKLDQRRKAMRAQDLRADLLTEMEDAIGDISRYESVLQEYIKAYEQESRSDDFKSIVANDIPYLEAVEEWNRLVGAWNAVTISPNIASVKEPLEHIGDIQAGFLDYPGVVNLEALRSYLESMDKRLNAAIDPIENIEQMFSHGWFSMKYVEQKSNGQRHYFFENPSESRKKLTINELTNALALEETRNRDFRPIDLEKLNSIKVHGDAPQTALAEKCMKYLIMDSWEFEKTICAILHTVLDADEVDPIIRALFLQLISEEGITNSAILETSLGDFSNSVQTDDDLGTINWLDTETGSSVPEVRARAEARLKRMHQSPLRIYKDEIEPQTDKFRSKEFKLPMLKWIGITRKRQNNWILVLNSNLSFDHRRPLYTPIFDQPTVAHLTEVGWFHGSDAELDLKKSNLLIEGQLLFAAQKTK